jgi:type II secretory pathway component PulF
MSNRYFRATYLTPEARKVRRVFFVPTMQDVRRELGVDGNVVQSITEHESNFFTREYYPRGYTLNFLKSLAFHIEVGTSAGQGVAHFIESERNAAKRAEMQPALERLTHGDSFGHA